MSGQARSILDALLDGTPKLASARRPGTPLDVIALQALACQHAARPRGAYLDVSS